MLRVLHVFLFVGLLITSTTMQAQPMLGAGLATLRQQTPYSCGLAALGTLLSRLGGMKVSEQALQDQLSAALVADAARDQRGYSLATLRDLAVSRGFSAQGVRVGLSRLLSFEPPFLVRLRSAEGHHYAAVTGTAPASDHASNDVTRVSSAGEISLADPQWGDIRMALAEFAALWLEPGGQTGIALLVRPPD